MIRQFVLQQVISPGLHSLSQGVIYLTVGGMMSLLSGTVLAADTSVEYGLAIDGNQLSHNYVQLPVNGKQQKEPPPLQLNVKYLDKTADLFTPHHSFNTEIEPKLNNRSHEIGTRLDYRFDYLIPKASFKYSPDSYGMGKYYNYELGIDVPVKDVFSLETHYGWNKFEKNPRQGGMENYQDWSIGVSTTYKGMKLKVDYIDVNAREDSQECQQSFPCEGKTVFSIIKNF